MKSNPILRVLINVDMTNWAESAKENSRTIEEELATHYDDIWHFLQECAGPEDITQGPHIYGENPDKPELVRLVRDWA